MGQSGPRRPVVRGSVGFGDIDPPCSTPSRAACTSLRATAVAGLARPGTSDKGEAMNEPNSQRPKEESAMWSWIVFIGLALIVASFMMSDSGDESAAPRGEYKSDREHIEEGAAKLDAFCNSNPDACY